MSLNFLPELKPSSMIGTRFINWNEFLELKQHIFDKTSRFKK